MRPCYDCSSVDAAARPDHVDEHAERDEHAVEASWCVPDVQNHWGLFVSARLPMIVHDPQHAEHACAKGRRCRVVITLA